MTIIPPWHEDDAEGVIEKFSTLTLENHKLLVRFRILQKKGRVVWLRGESNQELLALVTILSEKYKYVSQRPYMPHVTIARIYKRDIIESKKIKLNQKIDLSIRFSELSLYESRLSSKGSDYTILKSIHI